MYALCAEIVRTMRRNRLNYVPEPYELQAETVGTMRRIRMSQAPKPYELQTETMRQERTNRAPLNGDIT